MKAKDLKTGMVVAIKDGYKAHHLGGLRGISKAVVLDPAPWSTQVTFIRRPTFKRCDTWTGHGSTVTVGVPLAVDMGTRGWQPRLTQLSQIVGTWDEHERLMEVNKINNRAAEERNAAWAEATNQRFRNLGIETVYAYDRTRGCHISADVLDRLLALAERGYAAQQAEATVTEG